MMINAITQRNYERLGAAYDWFNGHLFENTLPPCLITFQRTRRARGYFRREALQARRGKRRTDEIALNPATFPDRSDREVMSTLVHEMVHLWQFHFGRPGRRGYHNRQWAKKMEEIGLRPSSTGRPGGAKTGESMSHYIISGGRFEIVWAELYRSRFRLEWEAPVPQPTDRAKVKYTCPHCGLNVWGKPGLAGAIICVDGTRPFVEAR
jgi:predicted SprT family Zn-dependent metalloprotease